MKKRLLSLALALTLALGLGPAARAASFLDVAEGAWYAPYIRVCSDAGLMIGVGDGLFAPETPLTWMQCTVMALRLYDMAHGGSGKLPAAPASWTDPDAPVGAWWRDAWYYGSSRGLRDTVVFSAASDRTSFAKKIDFVTDLPVRNTVYALPDTEEEAVLSLYRAGILNGVDDRGTFDGDKPLTRAEAAAMAARVLDASLRVDFNFQPQVIDGGEYTLSAVNLGAWTVQDGVNRVAAGWLPVKRPNYWGEYDYGIYRASDGAILNLWGMTVDMGDDVEYMGDARYAIVRSLTGDGLYGVYDVNAGAMAVECTYTDSAALKRWWGGTGELTPVCDVGGTNLWGYQNRTGGWVIRPEYAWADDFHDGYAVAGSYWAVENDKLVLTEYGTELLSGRYSFLSNLGDGIFYFENSNGYGLVTADGTETRIPTSLWWTADRYVYANHGRIPIENRYYSYTFEPLTPTFDWVGPLDANGAGFVQMDGVAYRFKFK